MGDGSGNGRVHDPDAVIADAADDADDDAPLTDDEAALASEIAAEAADESLDERVGDVADELDGVERRRDGESVVYEVRGRIIAVLTDETLEVPLDGPIGAAALKTGDTRPSRRGKDWVAFTPEAVDRFALDRAEAWVRFAHRRASGA